MGQYRTMGIVLGLKEVPLDNPVRAAISSGPIRHDVVRGPSR